MKARHITLIAAVAHLAVSMPEATSSRGEHLLTMATVYICATLILQRLDGLGGDR